MPNHSNNQQRITVKSPRRLWRWWLSKGARQQDTLWTCPTSEREKTTKRSHNLMWHKHWVDIGTYGDAWLRKELLTNIVSPQTRDLWDCKENESRGTWEGWYHYWHSHCYWLSYTNIESLQIMIINDCLNMVIMWTHGRLGQWAFWWTIIITNNIIFI